MRPTDNVFTVLFGVALLAALGVGGYVLFQHTYGLFTAVDQRLAAILVVTLIAALIIGLSIRRAGHMSGVRRLRLDKKAEGYGRLVEAWSGTLGPQQPRSETSAADPDVAHHLVLWASPGVLKQVAEYRRLSPGSVSTDPAMRLAIEKVLREMRNDLGQNNLGLGEGQLLELLLSDVGNAAPEAVRALNTNGEP